MKKVLCLLAALTLLVSLAACGGSDSLLDPKQPLTLTMWHVYGEQADSPMNRLVEEFNNTLGMEAGVVIDVTAMSNGSQIGAQLLEAQAGLPGAPEMPDLFFCHTSNAVSLGADTLLDWNTCFTEEERGHFVPEFLAEGSVEGRQIVFPVSKSTHLLFVNGTEFSRFSSATGVTYEDLSTWEGFLDAASRYHDWSGGKTFCAMDYVLRAMELSMLAKGQTVPMNGSWYDPADPALRQAFRPFGEALVQGHIGVSDLYANTQIMTGEVAAGLGSSAAILYYNDVVTYPDNTTEPMDLQILPMPQTAGGQNTVTQAGVGLAALSTTPEKAEAASLFAHWLTEPQRNLDFVAETGYMPVTTGAFEAISDYDFAQPNYAQLYDTLKTVRETSVSVTEPSMADYYGKVSRFYDALRSQQPLWRERSAAGESVSALEQECWALFSNLAE